jgi:predicted ester cyclase
MLSAFPDVSFRVEREFVSGETVVQEQVVEGHHEGSFLEIPATGASVRFRAAVVAECLEGRVAALRLYRDVSTFMPSSPSSSRLG